MKSPSASDAGAPDRSASAVEQLPAALAQRVLGWTVAPERFLTGRRGWIPRWHFQPLKRVEDAFKLLDAAATGFTLTLSGDQVFTALVRVGSNTGSATGESKAATITVALARAIGLDVPDSALDPERR
jgi:hypothetical protein